MKSARWTFLILLPLILAMCRSGGDEARIQSIESSEGYVVKYFDFDDRLVKRIELDLDSLHHGCYQIFDKEGDVVLQAFFSGGELHGTWMMAKKSCWSGGGLANGKKEGLWEHHKKHNGECLPIKSRGFREGELHGGSIYSEGSDGFWSYNLYNRGHLIGSAEVGDFGIREVSGELYFFGLDLATDMEGETTLLLFTAAIPGFFPEVSVLSETEDGETELILMPPAGYNNHMFFWRVDELRDKSFYEAGLADLKLLDGMGYDAYRELLYFPIIPGRPD